MRVTAILFIGFQAVFDLELFIFDHVLVLVLGVHGNNQDARHQESEHYQADKVGEVASQLDVICECLICLGIVVQLEIYYRTVWK